MKRSSPTRPLRGTGVVTTKSVCTECEQDGMPIRNICRSSGKSDPTQSRALRLIAAEDAERLRRHGKRESVRNMQRNQQKPENPVNEFALHTAGELSKEER